MKVSLRVVLKPLLDFVAQFVADPNNPTKVTAAQINAYTKTEIDKLLNDKLLLTDVPISYWGQSDSFVINVTNSISSLFIGTPVPAFLSGIRSVMPPTTLPVNIVAGQVTYIYLTVSGGYLMYMATPTEQAESSTMMYLGRTVGTNTGATLIDFKAVVRLGGKRLSTTRRGSAIPVSDSAGNTSW